MNRFAFALLLSVAGCSAPSESEPAATSDSIRTGTSIRVPGTMEQPAGVDPSAEYADSRSIVILAQVARLTPDELAVLERADRVVASGQPDRRVSVDELARLASPAFAAVLSPGEKAALVKVWRVMRAPRRETLPRDLPASLAPFTSASFRRSLPSPTPLVRPPERTTFGIDEAGTIFPFGASVIVERVERAFDDDDNPNTVSIADLAGALASPAFTASELDRIEKLKTALEKHAAQEADAIRDRAPKTMTAAEVHVPDPATARASVPIGTAGTLAIARDTVYQEWRDRPRGTDALTPAFTCMQTYRYTVEAAGGFVVALDPNTGFDRSANAGSLEVSHGSNVLAELWVDGEPRARVEMLTSALVFHAEQDLLPYLGHRLVTPAGKLVPYAVQAESGGARTIGRFHHLAARPEEIAFIHGATWRELFPESAWARRPGRYEIALPHATMRVDVYAPVALGSPFPATGDAGTGAALISFDRAMPGVPAGTVVATTRARANGLRSTQVSGVNVEVGPDFVLVHDASGTHRYALDETTRVAW